MLARTGLELPEVARPLAPDAQHWREINTMTIGYGHGISVTPLHVVNGVATLANGGVLRQPTLVAQAPGTAREGVRAVSEKTSETMRRLMRLVVTDGSGRGADVPGYFVGGKTGTAQKTGPRGGYLENKRIAAFVGAFPIHAPRYAIYVMVDEPKPNARSHGYATAGWVAAPAANMVISRVAPILGLLPETDRAQEIAQQIAMPLNGRMTLPPMGARPDWITAPAPVAATGRPGQPGRGGNPRQPAAAQPAATPPAATPPAATPPPTAAPPRPAVPTATRQRPAAPPRTAEASPAAAAAASRPMRETRLATTR
jgi:cell division protein FtsI (penicillin-binding protein 3)